MSCECEFRSRRWNPNTGRCETCRGNYAPARAGYEVPPPEPTDLRCALAAVFEDYASQALVRGDRFEHGTWLRAADIAREFVVSRRFSV